MDNYRECWQSDGRCLCKGTSAAVPSKVAIVRVAKSPGTVQSPDSIVVLFWPLAISFAVNHRYPAVVDTWRQSCRELGQQHSYEQFDDSQPRIEKIGEQKTRRQILDDQRQKRQPPIPEESNKRCRHQDNDYRGIPAQRFRPLKPIEYCWNIHKSILPEKEKTLNSKRRIGE